MRGGPSPSRVGRACRRVLPPSRPVCILRPYTTSATLIDPTHPYNIPTLANWRLASSAFPTPLSAGFSSPSSHSSTHTTIRPVSTTFKDEGDYNRVADATLEDVQNATEILEDSLDDFEMNYSQGVLNLHMGQHGVWVLNKQTPNRQIWWSSPISGPLRFEWDPSQQRWLATRNEKELFALLAEEILGVAKVDIRSSPSYPSTQR